MQEDGGLGFGPGWPLVVLWDMLPGLGIAIGTHLVAGLVGGYLEVAEVKNDIMGADPGPGRLRDSTRVLDMAGPVGDDLVKASTIKVDFVRIRIGVIVCGAGTLYLTKQL